MKNMWLVVALLVALVSVQCTGRTADDDAPVEQEVSSVEAVEVDLRQDLVLMEGTRLVVKVHPQEAFHGLQGGSIGDHFAAGEDAEEMMARLLGRALSGQKGEPLMLDGWSVEEPSFVAVSWGGNLEILEGLRAGAEMGFEESRVHPLKVRIFLRGDDPESLVDQVRARCDGSERGGCEAFQEVRQSGGFAMVDVDLFGFDWPEELAPPEWTGAEEEASGFVDWESPAGRAFVESDTPWSMYRTPELVAEFGTLAGIWEMSEPLLHVKERDMMAQRVLDEVSSVLMMESRDGQEFRDMADLIRVVDGALVVESVMSHSEIGTAIHEGARRVVEVPTVNVGRPHVTFAFAGDLDGGLEAAREPSWMEEARASDGMAAVAERYRDGGFMAYQVGIWENPWGMTKGLKELLEASGDPLITGVLQNLEGLIGARGALTTSQRPRGPGLEFDGGIALVFDGSVRDEDEIYEAMQEIPWGPVMGTFEMRFSVTSNGDDVVLLIGPGNHSTLFGEPQEVEVSSVMVHTAAIMGGQPAGLLPELMGRVHTEQRSTPTETTRRMTLGGGQ